MQNVFSNPSFLQALYVDFPFPLSLAWLLVPSFILYSYSFSSSYAPGALSTASVPSSTSSTLPFSSFSTAPTLSSPAINFDPHQSLLFFVIFLFHVVIYILRCFFCVCIRAAYHEQLQLLQEMGFMDDAANVQALLATGGVLNPAVDMLVQSQNLDGASSSLSLSLSSSSSSSSASSSSSQSSYF